MKVTRFIKVFEKLPLGVLIFVSLLSIVQLYKLVLSSPSDLHPTLSWAFSDYLINYSGGFVRRGLSGEILSLLDKELIVPVFNIFLMILFVVTMISFIYLARVTTSSFLIPSLAILLPAGLVSMSIYGDLEIVARKEMIFYCFTTYCAGQSVKNHRLNYLGSHNAQFTNPKILTAQIYIFSIFAMLTHEGFVFYSVPTLLVLLSFNTLNYTLRNRIIVLLIYLTLMFVVATIIVLNHGTPEISNTIILSLPDGLRIYDDAIKLIGWSVDELDRDVEEKIEFFNSLISVFFQALPIVVIYLVMFSLLCRKYSRRQAIIIDPVIQALLIFGFVALSMAPYFLISGDWARLVTAISINTLVLILVFTSTDRNCFESTFLINRIKSKFINNFKESVLSYRLVNEVRLKESKYALILVLIMFWMGTTFRVAYCCQYPHHVGMYGTYLYLGAMKDLVLFFRIF